MKAFVSGVASKAEAMMEMTLLRSVAAVAVGRCDIAMAWAYGHETHL
jgi:hypothetical protein